MFSRIFSCLQIEFIAKLKIVYVSLTHMTKKATQEFENVNLGI